MLEFYIISFGRNYFGHKTVDMKQTDYGRKKFSRSYSGYLILNSKVKKKKQFSIESKVRKVLCLSQFASFILERKSSIVFLKVFINTADKA